MANYIVSSDDFGFRIEETATGAVVARSADVEQVAQLKAAMNIKHTGFNGNTPEFFCNPPLFLDRVVITEEVESDAIEH